MNIFYTPDLDSDFYTLDETESKHCVRVLRMRVGDRLNLIDGKGGFFEAEITDDSPKSCKVKIVNSNIEYNKRKIHLHIAIAPTKNNDRIEWFLEKATEIGIDEITPLICDNSERKKINPERFDKIIVSAMKQSYKAYKPILNEFTDLYKFIDNHKNNNIGIAHCYNAEKVHINKFAENKEKLIILIGPEGDFSLKEVEYAICNGAIPISLSTSRLRTETAGVIVCSAVNLINEL